MFYFKALLILKGLLKRCYPNSHLPPPTFRLESKDLVLNWEGKMCYHRTHILPKLNIGTFYQFTCNFWSFWRDLNTEMRHSLFRSIYWYAKFKNNCLICSHSRHRFSQVASLGSGKQKIQFIHVGGSFLNIMLITVIMLLVFSSFSLYIFSFSLDSLVWV